jgi:putative transposase
VASVGRPVRRHEGQRRERLKELEGENARLKKLLAEAELDKSMLKELAEGNF